jgi:hypothetical protein
MAHHGGAAPEHEKPGSGDDVLPALERGEAGLAGFDGKKEKGDNQEKMGKLVDVESGIGVGLKGQGVIRQKSAQEQQQYGAQ